MAEADAGLGSPEYYRLSPRLSAAVFTGYGTAVPYYVPRIDVVTECVRLNGDVSVTVGVLPKGANESDTSVPLLNAATQRGTEAVFRNVPLDYGDTVVVARTTAQDGFSHAQYATTVNRMMPPPPPSPPPPSPPPPPPPPPPPSPPPPAFVTVLVSAPPAQHNSTTSRFEFMTPLCEGLSGDASCFHECKVDVAPWVDCDGGRGPSGSFEVTLNQGSHTLRVRARGHPSGDVIPPMVTEHSWRIDLEHPTVSMQQTYPFPGGLTYSNVAGSRVDNVRLVLSFSGEVVGMDPSRVKVVGGTFETYAELTRGRSYRISVSPGRNSQGFVTCTTSVDLNGVADAAGNAPVPAVMGKFNTTVEDLASPGQLTPRITVARSLSVGLTLDRKSPRVVRARVPQAYYGIAYAPNPVYFEFAFDEPMRTIDASGVMVSGGALQSMHMPNSTHVTVVVQGSSGRGLPSRANCDAEAARYAASFMNKATDETSVALPRFADPPDLRPNFADIIPTKGDLPCMAVALTRMRDGAGNLLSPTVAGMLVRYQPEPRKKKRLEIWQIFLVTLASLIAAVACLLAVLATRRSKGLEKWELAVAPPVKVYALDQADPVEQERGEAILGRSTR